MLMRFRSDQGFTLIEIVLAMAVLGLGMATVMTVFMTSLRWAEEVKLDLTALQAGRIALYDAGVLYDNNLQPLNFKNDVAEAKGWLNTYYIVRSIDAARTVNIIKKGGDFVHVDVKVYYGGDDATGELVHHLQMQQIIPDGY